jgi:hypothetical protein
VTRTARVLMPDGGDLEFLVARSQPAADRVYDLVHRHTTLVTAVLAVLATSLALWGLALLLAGFQR